MANAVAEGTKSTGMSDVELSFHVDAKKLTEFDAIILGAPTYHHDIPIDMKKLFETCVNNWINLKGKIGGAFGSYGWSGEAPKLLLEIMKNKFKMNVTTPPLLAKYVPDEVMLNKCRTFGRNISETLIRQV